MSQILFNQKLPLNFQPQKLDLAVTDLLQISRKKAQKMVDLGLVMVNHKRANRRSQMVKGEDFLQVLKLPEIENKNIEILFQNDQFLVINKPSGLSLEAKSNQLNQSLLPILKKQLKLQDLFLVHRLDTETSGCLIISKNEANQEEFLKKFKSKEIQKKYVAICLGLTDKTTGTIDKPLARVRAGVNKYHVDENGVWSKTDYKVLKSNFNEKMSLVELVPKTGRSHQIRVHLSSMGLPILGDKVYATISHSKQTLATHLMLHSLSITFDFAGQKYELTAKYDPEFVKIRDQYL